MVFRARTHMRFNEKFNLKTFFKDFFQIVSECPQNRIMGFLHILESKTSKGLLETCVLNKILVFYLNFKKIVHICILNLLKQESQAKRPRTEN